MMKIKIEFIYNLLLINVVFLVVQKLTKNKHLL